MHERVTVIDLPVRVGIKMTQVKKNIENFQSCHFYKFLAKIKKFLTNILELICNQFIVDIKY